MAVAIFEIHIVLIPCHIYYFCVYKKIQYLIRIHHDAGPDIGKMSVFSRPPRRIGGFCVGATPQQGGSTPEHVVQLE
jgi:hypothetical protein